jgi:hypothetical protein
MKRLWSRLGKLLDNAIAATVREFERLLRPLILEQPTDRTYITIATQYFQRSQQRGLRVGWRANSNYLQQVDSPIVIPPSVLDQLQSQANQNAGLLRSKLVAYLEEDITPAQVANWIKTAGQMQVFSGNDAGSRAAATIYEAEYKRWVRAWERREKRPHSSLEGAVILEEAFFILPSGARVYGPRDWDNYPEPSEWINCGHALQYERRPNQEELDAGNRVLYRP